MQRKYLEEVTNTKADISGAFSHVLFLHTIWHYRFWVLISVAFSTSAAWIYLRYATPQFQVTASILIRDDSKGTQLGDKTLENLGFFTPESNVDNEIEVLKSRTLMESVINDLQLYTQYHASGRIKTTELYEKSPFQLTFLNHKEDPAGKKNVSTYDVSLGNKNRFILSGHSVHINGTFGDTVCLPQGKAILDRTIQPFAAEDKYAITVSDKDQLVEKYSKGLSVSATNKMVSMVSFSLNEVLPAKGEAILERLISNYLQASIHDKNRMADSTLAFINQNLDEVSRELTSIEKQIEHFRRANHLTDKDENVRQLLVRSDRYTLDRNNLSIQMKVVRALQTYLGERPESIVPSSLVLKDPTFTALVQKYNELQLVRRGTLMSMEETHPSVQSMNAQLDLLRTDLLASINAQFQDIQFSLSGIDLLNNDFQEKLDRVPAQERIFLEYARQQQIKQDLYIYLLKKRVETAISKSSTLANAQIIDAPKSGSEPVKPNKQLVLLMSGFIGLGFPIAVLHLKDILNDKIRSRSELTAYVEAPVLAEIGHVNQIGSNMVETQNLNPVAEQFRVLRTNIQFVSASGEVKTILLTSSMGGEGKSFIAINLSHSLAMAGKKVILLELDLRRPRLAAYLNLKTNGFTDYVISDTELNDVIQQSRTQHQFDVLTCGTQPPNPFEMLAIPKVKTMISRLKDEYDYIILDTPPVGLVADARMLSEFADLCIYVVRQQFTFKHQMETIREIYESKQLPGFYLVLNDVRAMPGYENTYGYHQQQKSPFFIKNSM
ncbi:GumC family protein [Dyadobacter sediminis]|uniref:non-specific protein-tyrosine kinase n=1 Tax=Dyadobacter sediminis TaxID=1493691 RepID=A0A5R9K781_9BACT|nr:tyrosine-protein kinase family protein [Dyadobacter sediminis]TLU89736.1 polysaccharide biosynthesis tyrosine autokinase [Dyadobacter sediminis]GGC13159.1 tyrosine protein kinase [Dyadobacter sediminis]